MEISIIILLIWLHFFGDFILQTNKMATNKSTSLKWLTIHVVVYSIPFLIIGWQYMLVNMVLHFITDFITSRVASYFHKNDQRKLFFTTIGFDQAIHFTTLVLTYAWLVL